MVPETTIAWGAFALVPVLVGLAGLAWRKRAEPAGVPVAVYHLLLAFGAADYGLALLAREPTPKFLFTGFSLVLMSAFVSSWVGVALAYTGHRDWLTRPVTGLLAVEPAVLAVATAFPSLRPLVYEIPSTAGVGSIRAFGAEAGLLTVGHFLYLFALMVVATGLFINLFVRSRYLNRGQAVALLGAATAPWLTILVQAFDIVRTVDVSFASWTLAGVAITIGLYRIRLLDPVPVGRSAAIEEMADGVFVLDGDDRIADANPSVEDFFGVDGDDIRGEHVSTVVADWQSIPAAAGEWTEQAVTVEGDRRYVEIQTEPFTDHLDRRVGRLVVVRDVTARKRREQTLARYETVFETVQDRVYVLDSDGRFLLVNDPLAALLGRDRDTLVGAPFESVLAESVESFTPVPAGDGEVTGEPVELRLRTADGGTVPVETQFSPVEFDDVSGVVGYVRDISRRKETERSLAKTSERLDTLVHASPLAVVATDTEGNVVTWNPAAEEMFGYTEAEALGDVPPIIPDEREGPIVERFTQVLDGAQFRDVETRLACTDGTVIDASVSIAPQYGPAEEVRGTVSIIADITDRKERERQLQRQNERLDQFASIVSHDLRNPLNVASGRLELLAEEYDGEHLDPMADALDRMGTLIDETLTLAREGQTVADMETVALADLAAESWDRVDAEGTAASLTVATAAAVEADADRLRQVFENLFRNAVEHGGEDVTIRVGDLTHGFYIEDDGPGIPPDERDTVFQPGVTSNQDGTGFGLAIVREIVEAHGWDVDVSVGADGGARFEVTGVETARVLTLD